MGNRMRYSELKFHVALLYFPIVTILSSPIQSQQTPAPVISTDPSYYYNLCAPSVCRNFALTYPFTLSTPCQFPNIGVLCADNQSLYLTSNRNLDRYKVLSIDISDPSRILLAVAAANLFNCDLLSGPNYVNDPSYYTLHANYTLGLATHFNCTRPILSNSIPGLQNASCIGCKGKNPSNVCYFVSRFADGPDYCVTFYFFTPGVNFNASSVSNLRLYLQSGYKIWYTKSTECLGCEASGGRCGSHPVSGEYICFCASSVHHANCTDETILDLSTWTNTSRKHASRPSKAAIAAISSSALLVTVGALAALVFILVRRRKHSVNIDKETISSISPTRYTYAQLKKSTNNFSSKIGEGGFGTVYKGIIHQSGLEVHVAVKVLKQSRQTKTQFMNEVGTIGSIHHHNLVSMFGYCVEGKTHALVYEFLENGSLDKHIFKTQNETDTDSKNLSSKEMYLIALGTARGILYLHNGCSTKILHCDIKPPNVLLDSNFSAKVADFGLAKMIDKDRSHASLSAIQGTPGYSAPEVWLKNLGLLTDKSDVYSYGMLLLEIAGRRKNYNAEASGTSKVYFPEWLYNQVDKANFSSLIREMGCDDSFEGIQDEAENVLHRMCLVGLWCIQHIPSNRPSMDNVIQMLEGHVQIQIPPYPFPQNGTADQL